MAPFLSLLIWLMPIANQPGWLAHGPLRTEGMYKRVLARWSYSRRQESQGPGRKSGEILADESLELDDDDVVNLFLPTSSLPSRDTIGLSGHAPGMDSLDHFLDSRSPSRIRVLRC